MRSGGAERLGVIETGSGGVCHKTLRQSRALLLATCRPIERFENTISKAKDEPLLLQPFPVLALRA